MTYFEKLQDPRWQKRRLLIFQRAEFACENCGDADETLDVHHLYYLRKTEPWDYPDEAFLCLCRTCHDMRPDGERAVAVALAHCHYGTLMQIASLCSDMPDFEIQLRLMGERFANEH